jgi:Kef-type K+ transport system membrane component KefB
MNTITLIISLIIASNIAVFGLNKFEVSPVLTLLVFGLILSNNYFKKEIIPSKKTVDILGDLGIIAIMFVIGLKMNLKRLEINSRDTYILSFYCFIVPFVVGFFVFKLLGYSTMECFIVALVMTVTAEAVNGKLLLELDALDTDIGTTIMGIGIIDDFIGISIFSLILLFLSGSINKDIIIAILIVLAFGLGVYLKNRFKTIDFSIIQNILQILLVPFFFISMGLQFDVKYSINNPSLLAIVVLVAIFSKIGGTILARPYVDFYNNQLDIIGWGTNSRGVIGLAILLILFRNNLLSRELYSNLVLMILITTLSFIVVATKYIRKNKKILNKTQAQINKYYNRLTAPSQGFLNLF